MPTYGTANDYRNLQNKKRQPFSSRAAVACYLSSIGLPNTAGRNRWPRSSTDYINSLFRIGFAVWGIVRIRLTIWTGEVG